MRIRAITPMHVGADELARRQARYDRLAPPGTTVVLDDLGAGSDVPRALDTPADIRRSEQLVAALAAGTDPQHFDAVLPDCVLDPAVGGRFTAPVPVLGILRLSSHLLAGLGQPFAAVARNGAIADELAAKLRGYGMDDLLVAVRVLGLAVGDIADEQGWAAAVGSAIDGLEVGAVVNGCSAVEVPAGSGHGAVLDPTATALRLIGVADAAGLPALAPLAAGHAGA